MAQPTLLLKGSFDSFSIDDVLDVVGLSRQTMKVVLNEDGQQGAGQFLVKAGRVIHAESSSDRGRRAFVNIYREPGTSFAVWQHVEAVGEPIGMLADLIEEAKALEEAPVTPSRTPMLSGSFSDHRLDEVLDVLNMTRQLVEFKIRRDDDSSVIMLIKAGQVLACEDLRNSSNGLAAFRSLFKDPGQSFEVVRLDARQQDDLPPRIGTLSALVQEARKNEDQDAKKRPGVLFQGAFKNFPLSDVLEALSVTRLTVEMVFHDSDGTRGTFVLKAGQVLAAQSLRTGSSHAEAFHELMNEPGESFIVVRRPGTPSGEPIGRLRDLLSESRTARTAKSPTKKPAAAPRSAESTSGTQRITSLRPARSPSKPTPVAKPPPATRPPSGRTRMPTQKTSRGPAIPPPVPTTAAKPKPKPKPKPVIASSKSVTPLPRKSAAAASQGGIEIVLDGTFETFSIDDVLAVLGLSRQYIALGTLRNGAPLARIVVKSGRLLMASYGSTKEPAKALQMLLDDPGTEFRVRRLPRYADNDLGSFAEMIEEAKRNKDSSTVIHLPQPKPAPEQALPEIGEVDIDDLFAEVEEVPRIESKKPKAGGRKPYRPPESKLKRPPSEAQPEARSPEVKPPEVKPPEVKPPKLEPPKFETPQVVAPEPKPEPKLEPKPEPKPEVVAPEPEPEPATEVYSAGIFSRPPESTPAPEPEVAAEAVAPAPRPTPAPEPQVAAAPEPAPAPEPQVSAAAAPEPEREPVSEAPAAEPKVAARVAEPAAAAAVASPQIAQSLQLIEQRLRDPGAVGSEQAVAALETIGTHIVTLTEAVKDLSQHMAKMSEQTIAEARTTRTAMTFMQMVVLAGIAFLLWKALAGG
ncbi:MAG: hypothetical protein AAGF11_09110 [Myxococcota bacterium]